MRTVNRGRLALLAGAVVIAASLVALPATAFAARATTRIVVASKITVNNGTPGVTPWPKTLSAKLQKKSGTRYVAYTGTVKLYKWDRFAKIYRYKGSKRSSSPAFSLLSSLESPGRGKYKLYFAGTTTTLPCTAYSTVYETVGDTVTGPDLTFVPFDATSTWVNVKYDITWNTEAWDGPMVLGYNAWFEDDYAALVWVDFNREVWAPGTVEFNYKVNNTDLLETLYTSAGGWVDDYYDPYVVTPSFIESYHVVPR